MWMAAVTPTDIALVRRLLREERDRIERMMDAATAAWSAPGYQVYAWRDAHLAGERLKLAQANALIARYGWKS
jgi:hypothetical protein